jgi:hypothetical protein
VTGINKPLHRQRTVFTAKVSNSETLKQQNNVSKTTGFTTLIKNTEAKK